MAQWTFIDPNTLLPGDPWTSAKAQAAFENLEAIAEGAAGAPRMQTNAIQNSAVTTAKIANSAVTAAKLATGNSERNWVLGRTASAGVGAVGTYAMLAIFSDASTSAGGTRSGSGLRYASAGGNISGSGLAGTWRAMGNTLSGAGLQERTTIWLRIS